ncbi:MAG: hypothetical protein AB7O88_07090 [Reyranellaceae bacterium]
MLTTLLVVVALGLIVVLIVTIVWDRATQGTRVTIALPKVMTEAGVTQPAFSTAFADRINTVVQQSLRSTSPSIGWKNYDEGTLSTGASSTANGRDLLNVVSSLEGSAGLTGVSALVNAALELLDRLLPAPRSIDITMMMEPDGKGVLAQMRLFGFGTLSEPPPACRVATRDVDPLADCLTTSFLRAHNPLALVSACLPSGVRMDENGSVSAPTDTPAFLRAACADPAVLARALDRARQTAAPAEIPRVLNLEGRQAQQQGDYDSAIWKYRSAIRFARTLPGDQRELLATLYANLATAQTADMNDRRPTEQQASTAVASAVTAAELALDLSRVDKDKHVRAATLLAHILADSCRLRRIACASNAQCLIRCEADRAVLLMEAAHRANDLHDDPAANWVWGYALRSKADAASPPDEQARLFAAATEKFELSFLAGWTGNNIARRDAAQTALAEVRVRPDPARFKRAVTLTGMYLEFDPGEGPYPKLRQLMRDALRENGEIGYSIRLEQCYPTILQAPPREHARKLIECLPGLWSGAASDRALTDQR